MTQITQKKIRNPDTRVVGVIEAALGGSKLSVILNLRTLRWAYSLDKIDRGHTIRSSKETANFVCAISVGRNPAGKLV